MFDPSHNVVTMEEKLKTDITCLLGFGVSYICEVIGLGENWDIHVSIRSSHIANPVRVENPFQGVTAGAILTSVKISSLYLASEINNFLSEYHSANNRKHFLQPLTTLKNTDFNDQVQGLLSDYLWR